MAIEKHAFGETHSSNDLQQYHLHVQVVADQTSPTKSTIHQTIVNEEHLTRMMLTALLLRHPTMNFCLISEPKRRTGSSSPRLKGEAAWTGKALNPSARKRSGSVRNRLISRVVSRSSETAAALPPAKYARKRTKTYSTTEGYSQ